MSAFTRRRSYTTLTELQQVCLINKVANGLTEAQQVHLNEVILPKKGRSNNGYPNNYGRKK